MRDYQRNYSQTNKEMLNYRKRREKAKKIYKVLHDFSTDRSKELTDGICLDVGCSGGIITSYLADYFESVVGCDIDEEAIKVANASNSQPNCSFIVGDSMKLPFNDNSFDVVICNHVYEHVPDVNVLMNELYRVLKKNGVCYFGVGNKWIIIEPHYKLPFLSWLPKNIADKYIKTFTSNDEYYEKFLTYKQTLNLFSIHGFKHVDYTVKILSKPMEFNVTNNKLFLIILKVVPKWIWSLGHSLIPTYIFVLKKAKETKA
ncbi:class I SAM-dependent methyltransferase [Metallumcola ferriviriculae]|uniref:Class I SAM-dependent methyltransferase n=1 Tax=Metallumcola ferriviriculae TaxID=3039180 RepID=A0AAU0UHV7_9FIRM|nr:class I SAM-dependent methyltransferase [Desulfitibacteraceae bacterium MK1]